MLDSKTERNSTGTKVVLHLVTVNTVRRRNDQEVLKRFNYLETDALYLAAAVLDASTNGAGFLKTTEWK